MQHVEYENDISGFFPMKDEVIATFGDNGKIQTWKFDDKEKSESNDNDDNDYGKYDNDDNSETNENY